MPHPEGSKSVTFVAKGDTRATLERMAIEQDKPIARIALELIEAALSPVDAPIATEQTAATTPGMIDLAVVPFNWLTEELSRRVEDYAARARRLDAVEARLAAVTAALEGAAE